MRLLSALIITHCFGCVVPEVSDDEFACEPSISNHKSISDPSIALKQLSPVRSANYNDHAERCDSEIRSLTTYDHRTRANDTSGDISQKNHLIGDVHEHDEGLVYLLPRRSTPVEKQKKSTQVDIREVESRYRRRRRRVRPLNLLQRPRVKRKISCRRKAYTNPNLESDINSHEPEEIHRGHPLDLIAGIHRASLEKDEVDSETQTEDEHRVRKNDSGSSDGDEDIDDSEEDAEQWDEWAMWSECSTSCGCGRQVRWRHCSGKGCPTGLKQAQLKTCHVRDCDRKGFLSWLGIKS